MQMDITPISHLQPRKLTYAIHVRISRMWEFRGTNEQNDIRHLDLVLIDQKGDSIYAEILPEVISNVEKHLEEQKIVYIFKITVERAKPGYRVVDNPYMVKLNKRSEIKQCEGQVPGFPKYTFSLTPLDKLHQYTKKTDHFLDVIGRIRAVSNAAKVYTTSGDPIMRRVILLEDLKGNTIELSLSGKRAIEFDGEKVLSVGQDHHVIAIFVGTLMKLYRDEYRFLSGTSACRWYISENDIAEIKAFQKSLPSDPIPIQETYLQNDDDASQKFEVRTLQQLKHVDPFLDMRHKYQCTATIIGITENQTWCYRACKVCNSRMATKGNSYECTKESCPCTQFEWKYKIPFIASDDTCSLEFVFFEKKGQELIGKSAMTLRKEYEPKEIPSDITAWIGYKFTFVVKVLSTKSVNTDNPSFEVVMIKEKFGKQPLIAAINTKSSAAALTEYKDLPLLVPISSKETKNQHLSSLTENTRGAEDMDIKPSSIWEDSPTSNKRDFAETNYDSQDFIGDSDDSKKIKRMRSQWKTKN
ncbi:hypothetical protein BS78_03G118500 [Paspalum vaginatum]|nr:hypothetical protein BS78_03G118500 [Paspalum vaginatum]